jgi:hypothetical protein
MGIVDLSARATSEGAPVFIKDFQVQKPAADGARSVDEGHKMR